MRTDLKSQSAMEYLMTYGWAILIIAIVMVALFALGVFNPAGTTACIPNSGFLCSNMIFNSNTSNSYGDPSITVNIGAVLQQSWSNVYIFVVPEGQEITTTAYTPFSVADNPDDVLYWGKFYGQWAYTSSLQPGQVFIAQIYLNPDAPSAPWGYTSLQVGNKLAGSVWVMYTTPQAVNQIVELGTFTAVVVTDSA